MTRPLMLLLLLVAPLTAQTPTLPLGPGYSATFSSTLVVSGQYGGTTKEQQITNTITAAANGGFKFVYVRATLLPYTANIVTFNANIHVVCEGSDPTVYDIRCYGATIDGVTDDTPAWTAAIAGSNVAGSSVLHPGGVSGVTALTFPPLNRTRIVGKGPTKSTIKDISGNGLIVNFSTHLANEWGSGIEGMTIDGGGFTGPLLNISRASFFTLRDITLSNCTGTCLQLTSLWDCWLQNVFVSDYLGPIGTTASAVVIDAVSSPAGQEFDHNTIIGLHIEAAFPNAQQPLVLQGNATNVIRYNRFYDLKVHGDPNAGTPGTNLIYFSANATDNEVHGLKMASGNAAPQLRIDGHRNAIFGGQTNTGSALKATAAISLVGNDNRVVGFNVNDVTYTTADFLVSGSRNKFSGTVYNNGGPVLNNSGTGTVFEGVPGTTNRGDVSINVTPCVETEEQVWNTPLTAGRTVTIGTTVQRWPGARFRIIRSQTATGAFVLNVRDQASVVLRTLAPGEWVEIVYDDTNGWIVHAAGPTVASAGSVLSPYRILFQSSGLTTTSTSDVSVASVSMPAAQLAVNGQAVRVLMRGSGVTQATVPNVKFGATVISTGTITAGNVYEIDCTVTRTGATTQIATCTIDNGTALSVNSRTTPTETLANAITIDFRGSVTAGGTLNVDFVQVEYMSQ